MPGFRDAVAIELGKLRSCSSPGNRQAALTGVLMPPYKTAKPVGGSGGGDAIAASPHHRHDARRARASSSAHRRQRCGCTRCMRRTALCRHGNGIYKHCHVPLALTSSRCGTSKLGSLAGVAARNQTSEVLLSVLTTSRDTKTNVGHLRRPGRPRRAHRATGHQRTRRLQRCSFRFIITFRECTDALPAGSREFQGCCTELSNGSYGIPERTLTFQIRLCELQK